VAQATRQIEGALRQLPRHAPPPGLRERLIPAAAASRPARRNLQEVWSMKPVRWVGVPVALLALVAWGLFLIPFDRSGAVLAAVEKALGGVSHEMRQVFGPDGELIRTEKIWRGAEGQWRVETTNPKTGEVRQLISQEGRIVWTHTVGTSEYRFQWTAEAGGGWQPRLEEVDLSADEAIIPHPQPLGWIAFLRAAEASVNVRRETAEEEGKSVQIVTVQGVLPEPAPTQGPAQQSPRTADLTFILDAAMTTVLRYEATFRDQGGATLFRLVSQPGEDEAVEPEISLFRFQFPPGAAVFCEQTKQSISVADLVWDTLPESDKKALGQAIATLDEGWRTGDFAQFASVFDFAALPAAAEKGKFTAAQMGEWWADMVKRQRGRWAEWQSRVDYAFAAETPPRLITDFWDFNRLKPGQGRGITVLALIRVRATGQREAEEVRTMYYVRKTGRTYKVIGWRPPRD